MHSTKLKKSSKGTGKEGRMLESKGSLVNDRMLSAGLLCLEDKKVVLFI